MVYCVLVFLWLLLAFSSCLCYFIDVFFFKQKTAYEMRISDWSSDVCSSDLILVYLTIYITMNIGTLAVILCMRQKDVMVERIEDLKGLSKTQPGMAMAKIGRASCRERVCQYV